MNTEATTTVTTEPTAAATPIDIEALRQAGIQENLEYMAKERLTQIKDVDRLIGTLEAEASEDAAGSG